MIAIRWWWRDDEKYVERSKQDQIIIMLTWERRDIFMILYTARGSPKSVVCMCVYTARRFGKACEFLYDEKVSFSNRFTVYPAMCVPLQVVSEVRWLWLREVDICDGFWWWFTCSCIVPFMEYLYDYSWLAPYASSWSFCRHEDHQMKAVPWRRLMQCHCIFIPYSMIMVWRMIRPAAGWLNNCCCLWYEIVNSCHHHSVAFVE